MARTEGTPDGDILRADEGDDRRADGGGDVHGAAVVAEEKIELSREGGELADGERAVDEHEVGLGGGADGGEERLLGGAADEENPDIEFVLKTIAEGGEILGGPDAGGAAGAGVEKQTEGVRSAE